MSHNRPPLHTGSALLVALAGCGGGTDVVTPPPPPPPPSGFVVTFAPDTSDRSTAAALGWSTHIPNVDFVLTPSDSSGPPQSFRATAEGTFTLTDIRPGDYLVDAQRWLAPAETPLLPAGDAAVGFVSRLGIRVQASTGAVTVALQASRRKPLLISEWAFNYKAAPGIGGYFDGGFLEIHNDADSTIFLDGMVVAEGFAVDYDYPVNRCTDNLVFTDDPRGVYSRLAQKFPGSGRQFPVAPGATVTVATDAIDHSTIVPDGIDLSGADFEFSGASDADNPSVPNMIDVGLISYPAGHGLHWAGLGVVAVLARPVDFSGLPRVTSASGVTYARIARADLLDVMWIRSNFTGSPVPECPRLISPVIDRDGARVRGTDDQVEYRYSVSRRAAGVRIGGRTVLQHTGSSSVDLKRTLRTPGRVDP